VQVAPLVSEVSLGQEEMVGHLLVALAVLELPVVPVELVEQVTPGASLGQTSRVVYSTPVMPQQQ